jgi:hypothetical protein
VNPRLSGRNDNEDHATRLAVLIDADNAQAAVIEGLLAEIAGFGEATVKRIYGDFTSPASAQWKKVLNRHAIKPVQQFAYTTGKNATDSTMIIDAMDLLYTRRFDGFCLVSSDSDFTGLALRIREEGLTVLGFGEKKTPDAFRNACHKFVFTELLRSLPEQARAPAPVASAQPAQPAPPPEPVVAETGPEQPIEFPVQHFLRALDQASDDEGWAHLGAFGSYLTKLQPDFDPRLYGFRKLSDLVRSHHELFEVKDRAPVGSGVKALCVRRKA